MINETLLIEDSRQQLLSKAKTGANYKTDTSKGKNRYERRVHSKISSTVKEYNNIDMNKFFKDNILDVKIKVEGETDDYLVEISFGDVLDKLKDNISKNNGKFEFKVILQALIKCFNTNDVYVRCDCPDWQYRFGYWASIDDIIVGEKEKIPSDITNPDNKLGPACKHVCLVLSNLQWLYKVASTINNYVNYMESHYKQAYKGIIYPKLYDKDYELISDEEKNPRFYKVDSDEEIGTDSDLIKQSNEYGATRGRFKKGNTQGIRFAKNTNEPVVDEKEN